MSVSEDQFEIRAASAEDFPACEAILRSLPDWFGIESSIDQYAADLPGLTTLVAAVDDEVVGFLAMKFHFEISAEIYVLAVRAELHRKGIGATLLDRAERIAHAQGCEFLQVKTLGPSHPSPHYARTRQFYLDRGFVPLEELHGLWPGNPCLIMLKHLRSARHGSTARKEAR